MLALWLTTGILGRSEEPVELPSDLTLALSGIVTPTGSHSAGQIVKATTFIWDQLAKLVCNDWSKVYEIPPQKMEEFIAGAFDKAGFDEVVLTPRSGDHGRDVIARKSGVGCIQIIGSVKAYAPGHRVQYDDVRALIGVLSQDHSSSKAMLTTTSEFPKNITKDPFIAPLIPNRLELIDGVQLREWIKELSDNTN